MREHTRDGDGVYIETGEAGTRASFSAADVATAFEVAPDRVHRALAGEFGRSPDDRIDSQMAQHLGEVLLGNLPLDRQQAALMRLGAFTPRSDAEYGVGAGPPSEESDRQRADANVPDDRLASRRSSYDPATQDAS